MSAIVASRPLSPTSSSSAIRPHPPINLVNNTHRPQQEQEQVVDEILKELVRERQKRAELEVQVQELQAELQAQKKARRDEVVLPRKHYTALQTEVQGYRQLVEAMTAERPAVAAAIKSTMRQKIVQKQHTKNKNNIIRIPPSLPLHVIRLLEVMPWDSRAIEYASATEEMYEWQFYCSRTWVSELRKSPRCIRELPTEEPQPGVNANGSTITVARKLPFLSGVDVRSPPTRCCILTNQAITKRYDLQKGYPLPENGGTWQWVGGWRVEKRMEQTSSLVTPPPDRVDCDDEGWSYAMEVEHFRSNDPTDSCWDNAGKTNMNGHHGVLRPVRRRKWTRQRSLVDYPHASECSKSFLHLMARLTGATMAAHKISEQLVQTKVSLTEAESVVMQCKDELVRQVGSLKQVLETNSQVKATPKEAMASLQAANNAADKLQTEVLRQLDNAIQGPRS